MVCLEARPVKKRDLGLAGYFPAQVPAMPRSRGQGQQLIMCIIGIVHK